MSLPDGPAVSKWGGWSGSNAKDFSNTLIQSLSDQIWRPLQSSLRFAGGEWFKLEIVMCHRSLEPDTQHVPWRPEEAFLLLYNQETRRIDVECNIQSCGIEEEITDALVAFAWLDGREVGTAHVDPSVQGIHWVEEWLE
jgi:hypothetical protein